MERHGTGSPSHLDDCGRSITPVTPSVLTKALLPISGPDDTRTEDSQSADIDVSVPEFEGYLDILSYLQRDLPEKPSRAISTPSPPLMQVTIKTPKEEEWMSCRSPSQSSISNRSRSVAGGLSRTNSNTTKTVTPMSSVDSDSDLRLYAKQSIPTLAESRIEEVSESETASPHKTPQRGSLATPIKCVHCGRDPCGPDPDHTNSSLVTVLKAFEETDVQTEPEPEKRATGPSIQVEDAQGQRYLLYPQTSFFEAVKGVEHDEEEDTELDGGVGGDSDDGDGLRTFSMTALEIARRDLAFGMTDDQICEEDEDPNRASFWDDEDDSNRGTPTAPSAPYERPFNPDPYSLPLDSPSFDRLLRVQTSQEDSDDDHNDNDNDDDDKNNNNDNNNNDDDDDDTNLGRENRPTFWKDPDGVIVVYQGIEVNGRQMFYGADINYLGSFHDDEEDSSGLGSSHPSPVDPVGPQRGLFMIPEMSCSREYWDEDMF